VRRRRDDTQVIPGYIAAETVVLPRTPGALPPAPQRAGAARHSTQPAGAQRLVRLADRRGWARLLHLQVSASDDLCTAMAEVVGLGERQAQFLARARLAAEPALPRTANLDTVAVSVVRRVSRCRWHVHMEFHRGR
jgi:hypothetical protein